MFVKGFNFVILTLFAACLLIPSCKKETPVEPKQPDEVAKTASGTDVKPEVKPATGAKLEPLPIELPSAMFVGTPENIKVDNLEKPLGKARPAFMAPAGCVNLAAGKAVSGLEDDPIVGDLEMITDGDKSGADGSYAELGIDPQSIIIDLEKECEIYAVLFWHYHMQPRVYFDVVVQVSNDPDFIESTTLFNNDADNSASLGIGKDKNYIETSEGKLIDAKGVKGRYVRLTSNGNHNNDFNHYIEVEVFGK